ncbi:MAG: GatB/YqeY domain-containing protein [Corynebacterium sp.]|nr:GatB/YqeY domain-containing protein [Corynebacterium sp.]
MSDLQAAIRADLTAAMKARDKDVTGTLRMLMAALQKEATNGSKHELTDDDVLKVVAHEVKTRNESAQIYLENGRPELAEQERAEAAIIARYQPKQLDDAELTALVESVIAETGTGMANMGAAMKLAKEKAGNAASGKRLSEEVKRQLAG